jgi:hypothetical protein
MLQYQSFKAFLKGAKQMVYMALNTADGKYYVGQTRNLDNRKKVHKTRAKSGFTGLLYDAIREHGFDAFEWFVLLDVTEQEEMDKWEFLFIQAFKAYDPRCGYNHNCGRTQPIITDAQASQASIAAFEAAFS